MNSIQPSRVSRGGLAVRGVLVALLIGLLTCGPTGTAQAVAAEDGPTYVIDPPGSGGAPDCGEDHVFVTGRNYYPDAWLLTFKIVAVDMGPIMGGKNKTGFIEYYIYDNALGNDHVGPYGFSAGAGYTSPELHVQIPQSTDPLVTVLVQNANHRTVCAQTVEP